MPYKFSKTIFKNFISLNEVRLLKNSLERGRINKLNIVLGFLLINIFLSLPFTYLIRADFLDLSDKENKNVGFIIYRKNPFYKDKRYNIDLLVIKKNFRNKGFGSKLLDKMVSQIEMHNPKIKKILIYAQTLKFDNLAGNYFYQKNNFELIKSDYKFNSYLKTIEI